MRRFCISLAVACLLFILTATGAPGSNASNPPLVPQEVIDQRLRLYSGTNSEREQTLKKLFEEAGCTSSHLTEQPMGRKTAPNLICTQPGESASEILIGAHFDYINKGRGVIDNWSGASLLPSLYQSLGPGPHKHTFVFVGFSEEEKGLVGSRKYVRKLKREGRAEIHAMVNVDSLALGPPKVWATHSSPELVAAARNVAHAMGFYLQEVDAEKVGDDDSHPFKDRKIPTLMIHSIMQDTLSIIHSPRDTMEAVDSKGYYESYRFLVALLRYLDLTVN